MIALHARFIIFGRSLEVVENGYIEVDEEGVVRGLGRQPPTVNYARLGNVVILPSFINAHVHLLDLPILDLDEYYIDDLVGGTYSIKYMSIRKLVRSLSRYVRKAYEVLKAYGWSCVMPFVEYGAVTGRLVREVAGSFDIDTIVLGELTPGSSSFDELETLRKVSDGIAVISPLSHEEDFLSSLRKLVDIPLATHVSEIEETYEGGDLDLALRLKFDILVHLTKVREQDIERLKSVGVLAVLCPRANAFFSRSYPPLGKLLPLKPCVGTDNLFAVEPDPFKEMEFIYRMSLMSSTPLDDRHVLSMLTVWPREWMDKLFPGKCGGGLIDIGLELNAIVLLLRYDNVKDPIKYVVRRSQASDLVAQIRRGKFDLIRKALL